MEIRIATPADAGQIQGIYKYYVENTSITFEYDAPTVSEMAQRIADTLKRYPYLVAEENGTMYGYAYAGAFKGRRAYDWSVETSIYVDSNRLGGGIGSMLYSKLEEYLAMQNIINVNACITHPNIESEAFHRKHGYELVAHFKKIGFKQGKWRDMVWMQKHLSEYLSEPEPFIPFPQLSGRL